MAKMTVDAVNRALFSAKVKKQAAECRAEGRVPVRGHLRRSKNGGAHKVKRTCRKKPTRA